MTIIVYYEETKFPKGPILTAGQVKWIAPAVSLPREYNDDYIEVIDDDPYVMARYYSVDENTGEKEFLYEIHGAATIQDVVNFISEKHQAIEQVLLDMEDAKLEDGEG